MTNVEQQNYQVLITRENGHAAWCAVVLGMPAIFAEAGSREEVIKEITERLRTASQHAGKDGRHQRAVSENVRDLRASPVMSQGM